MPFSRFFKINAPDRYKDFFAIGGIVLYCLAYASLRILISQSMEPDEAEQFLDGSVFSFGYRNQAPLYSWIVKATSLVFGMNFVTLVVVKYCLLFSFYLSFFLIARSFWDSKRAFLITGSLLLFPTYSYEANRDLSHTILVSVMALMTCFFYIRILREGRTIYYFLIGIFIGLGILSKYNFTFFLGALILSSLVTREGRRVIFDKRIFLSFMCGVLALLPHFLWLTQENFSSLHYALSRSRAGELSFGSPFRVFSRVGSSSIEVLPFFFVSALIFRRHISINENKGNHVLLIFRSLAIFGFMIPLSVVILLHTGNFSSRWLAPVLFTLPLALFSMVSQHVGKNESRLFGALCLLIAVSILATRAFIGFLPDRAGKVERIHIPYRVLSQQLIEKLEKKGMHDFRDLVVIADADDAYVAANIIANLPGAKFVSLRDLTDDGSPRREVMDKGGILVSDISRHGGNIPKSFLAAFPSSLPIDKLQAPYIRSDKFPPYILGVVIIPGKRIEEKWSLKRNPTPVISNLPVYFFEKRDQIGHSIDQVIGMLYHFDGPVAVGDRNRSDSRRLSGIDIKIAVSDDHRL